MEFTVLTSSITEPVTHADVKLFMGYPSAETSQDDLIDGKITEAREFVEAYTGLSLVSKSYKAYFEKEDAYEGWFELPVSPVLSDPVITCEINGTSTTFQQKGLKMVSVKPDNVIGTIGVGSTATSWYMEVTFQAGATNKTANECIKSIAAMLFVYRQDGMNANIASLPFDTVRMLNSISTNV